MVSFKNTDAFEKMPKESFAIENSTLKQLDFPFNFAMFTFAQFKLANNFKKEESFKSVKMTFHAILKQKEEEICSLKKIVNLI